MESLKDPSMIVAMVSLLGTVGSSVYSYRHINVLEEQVEEIQRILKEMNGAIIQQKQILAGVQEIPKAIKDLNTKQIKQNAKVLDLQDSQSEMEEQIEDLEDQVRKIIEVLIATSDGKVDAKNLMPEPRKKAKKSKPKAKSSGKKSVKFDSDEDDEDLEEISDEEPPRRRR